MRRFSRERELVLRGGRLPINCGESIAGIRVRLVPVRGHAEKQGNADSVSVSYSGEAGRQSSRYVFGGLGTRTRDSEQFEGRQALIPSPKV